MEIWQAWAAGFLDGEGSFDCAWRQGTKRMSIQCAQVQKWPLEKLVEIFGGGLCYVDSQHKKNPKASPYWKWHLYGKRGLDVALLLRPMMSPRRQERIDEMLSLWLEPSGLNAHQLNAAKTHCKRGHPLTGYNLQMVGDGRRQCRTCQQASQKKYEAKVKLYKLGESNG